jgi:hypothetical protein
MWIVCCGMIRSGSTLQYQLTKEIVESSGYGIGVGWMDKEQLKFELQKTTDEKKLKVVKCHDYFKEVSDLILRDKAKGIYVYRDLRDVIVSLMNKRNQNFESIFSIEMIKSLIDHNMKWNRIETLYVSKYEEMMTNLPDEISNIAALLEISIDNSFVTNVAQKYSLKNQKKRISEFNYNDLGTHSVDDVYDSSSLLHKDHIHSGKSKQWETELSRYQIASIENIAYEWLIEKDYPISQNSLVRKMANIYFVIFFIKKLIARINV